MYEIIRMYSDNRGCDVRKGLSDLTLEEAQEHCDDPETSSNSCLSDAKRNQYGENVSWFDGYRET